MAAFNSFSYCFSYRGIAGMTPSFFLGPFRNVLLESLGELGPMDLAAQCLSVNSEIAAPLSERLGCDVFFTLGWVEVESIPFFQFDEIFIEKCLQNGYRSDTINIHAWLTLPSMEIVDLTIATTYAIATGRYETLGSASAQHADEFLGMRYHPMLVGLDFILRIGAIRGVRFTI